MRKSAIGAGLALLVACGSGDRPTRTNLSRAPKDHRATAPACTAAPAREPAIGSGVTSLGCAKNADCTSGRNGRCAVAGTATSCVYDACLVARDCAGIAVCECGAPNQCVPDGCSTDADCGEGGYCSPSPCSAAAAVPHYCHTIEDQCFDDEDCGVGANVCRYQASSRTWRCVTSCR